MRKLFGLHGDKKPGRVERPGEDIVFEHLWRTAAGASAHGRRFSIHQPNVLLFQMGKVASSALEVALIDRGINCFHCHSLRHQDEALRLSRMFQAEPGFRLAAMDLKLLAKHTSLNMLTRWYRTNEVSPDRRLKVITLTRDPFTWYVSQFLQRVGHDPQCLNDWHREFTNGKGENGDVRAAAGALLHHVGQLIVESRPSIDPAAARARGHALALAMTPPQPYIAENIRRALQPLAWFDEQFTPMFGVDIRALPDFAERGLAHRDLGFADLLIVRFEDLGRHMDAIGRFVGLPGLEIPPRNVTAAKPFAGQVLEAVRSFQATELGIAFQRELRHSDYGRACAYDRQAESRG